MKPHFLSVPPHSHSLVQTPRHVEVKSYNTGGYVHIVHADGIQRTLENKNTSYMQINVDFAIWWLVVV